jgi:hypothetical protein
MTNMLFILLYIYNLCYILVECLYDYLSTEQLDLSLVKC